MKILLTKPEDKDAFDVLIEGEDDHLTAVLLNTMIDKPRLSKIIDKTYNIMMAQVMASIEEEDREKAIGSMVLRLEENIERILKSAAAAKS